MKTRLKEIMASLDENGAEIPNVGRVAKHVRPHPKSYYQRQCARCKAAIGPETVFEAQEGAIGS